MKNILVIGAAGQIGSELVPELRRRGYMTVAAGSGRTPLTAALSEGGPTAVVNLLDADGLRRTVEHYAIDTIFNMAAILSAVGESKPMTAWDIGVNGVIGFSSSHATRTSPSSHRAPSGSSVPKRPMIRRLRTRSAGRGRCTASRRWQASCSPTTTGRSTASTPEASGIRASSPT